jgi:hypothetical protein
MNQPIAPQPAREEKSNTWKWLLVGCFGFLLLGGGTAAFMGWQMYKSFSMKPADVEAVAQKILPFEKPEGYEGKFSMAMMGVNMVMLASQGKPESSGMIMLMTIPGGKNNRDALRKSMNDNMERQNAGKDISSQKLAPQSFKVRGENTPAEVQKFDHKQGGEASLQYTLYVTSAKGDLVLVNVTGPETTTTHDWVQKFLDTVK